MTGKDSVTVTVFRRVFLVTMLAGIFYLSHQPSLKLVPPLFPHQDKLIHAIEFFLLMAALLLNRDLCRGYHPVWILTGFACIWAVSDEIHQSFVPGRDCSAGDLIADLAGILLCLVVYILWRDKRSQSS